MDLIWWNDSIIGTCQKTFINLMFQCLFIQDKFGKDLKILFQSFVTVFMSLIKCTE